MKTILLSVFAIVLLYISGDCNAQNQPGNKIEWTGSTEQKIYGLTTIWSEAKYNFPWFDKLPNLDWDAKLQEYIPRVIEAKDIDSYYKILSEFITLLNDGHTLISPPWFPLKQTDDLPTVELQIVENKFIVARTGDTEENKNQNIYPGLEILEVDNIPIAKYFQDQVLRYNTNGTTQSDQIEVWSLFLGMRNTQISCKAKNIDGTTRDIRFTRNGFASQSPFIPRFAQWNGFDKTLELKALSDGIQYVRIPNFTTNTMVKEFQDMIDNLELSKTKGMIIDLRYNSGGNDAIEKRMVSCLIDKTTSTPLLKFPQYIGAYRAWGQSTPLLETSDIIVPRKGKNYLGPLVLLTGIGTASTAEDMAIELSFSGRALLVGEKTPGSAGNSLRIALPGGGTAKISTFRSYFPDGTEYMHSGVQPDIEVNTTQKDLIENKEPILEKALEVLANWDLHNKKTKTFKLSAANKIGEILSNSNYKSSESSIISVLNDKDQFYCLEAELNNLGYDLIKQNKPKDALEIFKKITVLYPASWNAYDSLGEAYMKAGNKELAIENYEKSLKINPNSKSGTEALKILRK